MTTLSYWQALRWHLLALLLVILSGSIATGIHLFKYSTLDNELNQVQQQLRAEQKRVTQQAAYKKDVGFFLSNKARWEQLGLGRAADPVQWIDSWHVLQQQSQLPHMQYDIQPSATCEAVTCHQFLPIPNVSNVSMTITPVSMRWSVAHEAEVLTWLQPLQQKYAGMLLVRACQWTVAGSAPLIDAQCELQWFNFPGSLPASVSAT
jgi:hypothetical protein